MKVNPVPITELCKERTLTEIAAEVGCNVSTLARIKNGRYDHKMTALLEKQLMRVLKLKSRSELYLTETN